MSQKLARGPSSAERPEGVASATLLTKGARVNRQVGHKLLLAYRDGDAIIYIYTDLTREGPC